jgi:serpin B
MGKLPLHLLVVLALSALLTGCLRSGPPGEEAEEEQAKPKADRSTAEDQSRAAADNTAFAIDLYAQLRGREGNLFLSPYSISTAAAMTYAGARGETAEQMAKTMHFTLSQERLHPALAALTRDLQGGDKKPAYELAIANALWGQKGRGFRAEFLKLNKECYGAGLNEVDFQQTDAARKTINAWVKDKTRGKISELLQPEDINARMELALTNAVYFKGEWAAPFSKNSTTKKKFHTEGDKTVDVPMMSQTNGFKFLEQADFAALELPYAGDRLSMVVFLPRKQDGLAEWEKSLTADKLKDWLAKLSRDLVSVELPRFKTRARFSLVPTLSDMGMKLAFSEDADLSGISDSPTHQLVTAVHEAFVEVNEEGTEAVAATGKDKDKGGDHKEPVAKKFRADHPFFFLIRDTKSGSILFMGRVTNPDQ